MGNWINKPSHSGFWWAQGMVGASVVHVDIDKGVFTWCGDATEESIEEEASQYKWQPVAKPE